MNLIVYFVTLRSQVFRNGINYVKSFCNRIVSTSAADAAAAVAGPGRGSEAEGIEFNWKVAHCFCCCCCAKEQIKQVCGKCQRWTRFVWGIKVFGWFRPRPEAKIIGSLSDRVRLRRSILLSAPLSYRCDSFYAHFVTHLIDHQYFAREEIS